MGDGSGAKGGTTSNEPVDKHCQNELRSRAKHSNHGGNLERSISYRRMIQVQRKGQYQRDHSQMKPKNLQHHQSRAVLLGREVRRRKMDPTQSKGRHRRCRSTNVVATRPPKTKSPNRPPWAFQLRASNPSGRATGSGRCARRSTSEGGVGPAASGARPDSNIRPEQRRARGEGWDVGGRLRRQGRDDIERTSRQALSE